MMTALMMATSSLAQSSNDLVEAEKRIAYFRQGNLRVEVLDANGQAVANAAVTVTQQRHQFLFGGATFNVQPDDPSAEQQRYQQAFLDIFNYGTVPFYWGSFEAEQNKPNYVGTDKVVAWAKAQGLTLKGHPLVWHQVYPDWAPKEADAAIPLLEKRVKDIIEHYQDDIAFWDVINEANSPENAPENGVSKWLERDGSTNVVGTTLDWAAKAGGQTLLYNDYELTSDYLDLIRDLQSGYAGLDVLGLQSHQHSGAWSLSDIDNKCRTFSELGLPLHFTEVTFVSGDLLADWSKPPPTVWPSTSEGEARQARDVKTFYTLLYACPAVQAITWWDVSDKNAWLGAPSGLLRADMTPKPAYDVLKNLIKETWWTDVEGQTDNSGNFATRVTLGTHEVTVMMGTQTVQQTVEVTKNGDEETLVTVRLE
jgi:endo-1,4-beta-xylanase